MANPEIERLVDELISKGRVSREMRDTYIKDIEEGGFSDSFLRGADYTNKSKELANQRREAEAAVQQERQKLQADRQKLEGWYNQVQGELTEAEKLKSAAAAYKQKLIDYQIYDESDDTLPRTPNNPSYKPPTQPTQTTPVNKFLTLDDANKFGGNLLNLMKVVNKIEREHRTLYGRELDEDLIDHFTQTGQDPYEYWRVKYAVDNRRTEIAQKEQEAHMAKMEQEIREKVMREFATDPSRVIGSPNNGSQRGGLTPVMEQYAHSRATAHSGAAPGESTPKAEDFIPPEQRPIVQSAQARISSAINKFNQNWDPYGQPISEEGRKLSERYRD